MSAEEMRRISHEQQRRQCKLYEKVHNRIIRLIHQASTNGDTSLIAIIPPSIDGYNTYNREKCFKYVNNKLKEVGYTTYSNIQNFSIEIDWSGGDTDADLSTYKSEQTVLDSVLREVHQTNPLHLPPSVQDTIRQIKFDQMTGIDKISRPMR